MTTNGSCAAGPNMVCGIDKLSSRADWPAFAPGFFLERSILC